MDIGDRPDATMWTDWVSPETLSVGEEHFSMSWYSFDYGGVHFAVINSPATLTSGHSIASATPDFSWRR